MHQLETVLARLRDQDRDVPIDDLISRIEVGLSDSATAESRSDATPTSGIGERSPVASRRPVLIALAAAVAVFLAIAIPTLLLGGAERRVVVEEPATSVPAPDPETTDTTVEGANSDLSDVEESAVDSTDDWERSWTAITETTWTLHTGSELHLEPTIIEADLGPIEIRVSGSSTASGIWVGSCPAAGVEVDPTKWNMDAPDDLLADCWPDLDRARESRSMVNLDSPTADSAIGSFSTVLTIDVDQAMIDAGGLVILVGDIFAPIEATALLQIASDPWLYGLQRLVRTGDQSAMAIGSLGLVGLGTHEDFPNWSGDASNRAAWHGFADLPIGRPPDGEGSAADTRQIATAAIDPDGQIWVAGWSVSSSADVEFGGTVDEFFDVRWLPWVAKPECVVSGCSWTVYSGNEVPELVGADIGAMAFGPDGTLWMTASANKLIQFDRSTWTTHRVPGFDVQGYNSPWSSSISVDETGAVWMGTNPHQLHVVDGPDRGVGLGLVHFFEGEFSVITEEHGLPSNVVPWVVTSHADATDNTTWIATDAVYEDPSAADPTAASGIARFGPLPVWEVFTVEDGLLSNDATLIPGQNGEMWAVHSEVPPFGYSHFDGDTWTAYPTDERPGDGSRGIYLDGRVLTVSGDGSLVSFDGVRHEAFRSPFLP